MSNIYGSRLNNPLYRIFILFYLLIWYDLQIYQHDKLCLMLPILVFLVNQQFN